MGAGQLRGGQPVAKQWLEGGAFCLHRLAGDNKQPVERPGQGGWDGDMVIYPERRDRKMCKEREGRRLALYSVCW